MPRLLALVAVIALVVFGTSANAQRRENTATEDVARVAAPGHHHIPLSGGSKHLIVRGTLNDTLSGPLLIDTGASYCVLTHATAARLGVRPRTGVSVPVATANGEVEADLVRLDSIQIEDARLGGVDAVVMDAVEPPLVGIIGLSFLNQFRRYSVDQARGTIQLER
jgi:clan AA aspartic protease (TIGR02281 family)